MSVQEVENYKELFTKRIWFTNYLNKKIYDRNLYNQNTTLIIRRDHILIDSFNQFITTKDLDLRRAMQIFFVDEVAQDTGGVYREWYTNIFNEIFSEEQNFFKKVENKKFGKTSYFLSENSPLIHKDKSSMFYELIGQLIAKAILDKILLPNDLNLVLLKHILDIPITLDDIKYLSYDVSCFLKKVL